MAVRTPDSSLHFSGWMYGSSSSSSLTLDLSRGERKSHMKKSRAEWRCTQLTPYFYSGVLVGARSNGSPAFRSCFIMRLPAASISYWINITPLAS